jgi:hypothetical protein
MKGQLEKNNIDMKEVNLISLLIIVFFLIDIEKQVVQVRLTM